VVPGVGCRRCFCDNCYFRVLCLAGSGCAMAAPVPAPASTGLPRFGQRFVFRVRFCKFRGLVILILRSRPRSCSALSWKPHLVHAAHARQLSVVSCKPPPLHAERATLPFALYLSFGSTGQHDVGAGPHGFCRTTGAGQHGEGFCRTTGAGQHGRTTGAGQYGRTTGAGQPQLCWSLSLACRAGDPRPHKATASVTTNSPHMVNLEGYILPPMALILLLQCETVDYTEAPAVPTRERGCQKV